jgi:hypothetical protein
MCKGAPFGSPPVVRAAVYRGRGWPRSCASESLRSCPRNRAAQDESPWGELTLICCARFLGEPGLFPFLVLREAKCGHPGATRAVGAIAGRISDGISIHAQIAGTEARKGHRGSRHGYLGESGNESTAKPARGADRLRTGEEKQASRIRCAEDVPLLRLVLLAWCDGPFDAARERPNAQAAWSQIGTYEP